MSAQRVRKLRERRRVPLRVGDVWIYVGPATEVRIAALSPRPTSQKPRSQAVTLDDGRTIAEATLRFAYMRKQEYLAWVPSVANKWQRAKAEFFGETLPTATVLPFRKPRASLGEEV